MRIEKESLTKSESSKFPTLCGMFAAAMFLLLSQGVSKAGEVYVWFHNNDVYVSGSEHDNELFIGKSHGRLFFYADEATTKIWVVNGPYLLEQDDIGYVTAPWTSWDDVRIEMGDKNDTVRCVSIEGSGSNPDLIVNMGNGADNIQANEMDLRYLDVYCGSGDDSVSIWDNDARAVYIHGGHGNDTIQATDNVIDDSVRIHGWVGNDDIVLKGTECDWMDVNGGSGNDSIDLDGCTVGLSVTIDGYNGDDSMALTYVNGNPHVYLEGASGNDTIWVGYSQIILLDVETEDGFDRVTTWESTFDNVEVRCGNDIDSIDILNSVVHENLKLFGGAENDTITVRQTDITQDCYLYGGSGADLFELLSSLGSDTRIYGGTDYDCLDTDVRRLPFQPWPFSTNSVEQIK